ncbi:MAG: lysophospholipid transporter LplT, partial [Betaproteobacteria bacterium]|nr:lysophospholipid transporter LplT [Betaproteobacteria bacterium]
APVRSLPLHGAADAALAVIGLVYVVAALCNLRIPDTGARYPHQTVNPLRQMGEFVHCTRVLWSDKLGQISMAVTTLFWGAGATLQFIVIKWAEAALGLNLSNAAVLQATVAFGVAFGAMLAATRVPLKNSLRVLPVGMGMGVVCTVVALYSRDVVPELQFSVGHMHLPLYLLLAGVFMVLIGAMAGYFVVPMNALLQHRGYVLLSAGHSIAVQNFNENVSVLVMLGLYSLLIGLDLSVRTTMLLFGVFIVGTMWLVMRWNAANMRQRDWTQLIGEPRHPAQP